MVQGKHAGQSSPARYCHTVTSANSDSSQQLLSTIPSEICEAVFVARRCCSDQEQIHGSL